VKLRKLRHWTAKFFGFKYWSRDGAPGVVDGSHREGYGKRGGGFDYRTRAEIRDADTRADAAVEAKAVAGSFICAACMRLKPAAELGWSDPMLCQGCIDADNERERRLTFGDR
jgi:hypothetical protein